MKKTHCYSGKSTSRILISIISVLVLCLTGCGKSTNEENDTITESMGVIGTEWQKTGFRMDAVSTASQIEGLENPPFHEVEYQDISFNEPEFEYLTKGEVTGIFDNILYLWSTYELPEEQRFALQRYYAATDESEMVEIKLPEEISGGYAWKMDVLSEDNICVLFVEKLEQGERHWVLKLDGTGKVNSAAALEGGDLQEKEVEISDFYVDGQGYSYILGQGEALLSLYVFDANGKSVWKQGLTDEDSGWGCCAFHAPDGSIIFQVLNQSEGVTKLLWYELPDKKPKELAEWNGVAAPCTTMNEDGTVYMIPGSYLLRWNVITGKQEPIFNFIQSNISTLQMHYIEVSAEGEIWLYQDSIDNRSVYVLSEKEIEKEQGLVLANLSYVDNYVKAEAAGFSRKNADIPITFQTGSGDTEAYHDRIMAELVSGKGPDLLWVDAEDMQILHEKGALMDLRELIPEDTLEQIFPGIIASGTVEDTLVGLYFDAYACTFLVSDKLWAGESWTTQDIINVAKKNRKLQGLVGAEPGFAMSSIFSALTMNDLDSSPFIDIKGGKSNFDTPQFIELLELIKQYGDNSNKSGDMKKKVKDGEYLSFRINIQARDLPRYSELMKEYGEDCHLIGNPNSGRYQGFWPWSSFLVVNAKAANKEVVAEFFDFLLSATEQRNVALGSVRRDIIQQNTFYNDYNGKYYYKSESGNYELETKEDGSSYLEDYLNFLENCAPLPHSYEALEEIVFSEVAAYFDGTQSAEQAAKVIDNRVQLYLDERK